MPKVLVTETISETGLAELEQAGLTVDLRTQLGPDELLDAVADCDALIVRSQTQVTAEVLAAAPELKIVARAGVGVDNVDIAAATSRGVAVVNAPLSNSLSAAEHTMGLLLAQARSIPQAHSDLTAGNWNRSQFQGVELSGKTLGIVGLGRIGQLVAERAAGFLMQLVGFDPYVSDEIFERYQVKRLSLDELVAAADFLTLHVAKTPETENLINAKLLARAKPSLRVINVSRGGMVNEADLAAAIRAGSIGGAALDVFEAEPLTESPLFELPQVVVTPHLGASTAEAQDKAGLSVARQVVQMLEGQLPRFAVNIATGKSAQEIRPFLPLCEQLGGIFHGLVESLPATLEVEFSGQIADCDPRAGAIAVLTGLLRQISEQPITYVNAEDIAKDRGLEVRMIATRSPQDYVNEITLRGGGHEVGGTLLGLRSQTHITRIEGHRVDLPPSKNMLAIRNHDRPGSIGEIGRVLGEAQVNIDNMDVGHAENNEALTLIATSIPVADSVADRLRQVDSVIEVRVINLV